jgi:hypothetical protein
VLLHLVLLRTTAHAATRPLPQTPTPNLDPRQLVDSALRALVPSTTTPPTTSATITQDDALRRLFAHATYECRAALTARKGKDCADRFVQHAPSSHALGAILRAYSYAISAETTLIAGTPTRGALATQLVAIQELASPRHPSGHLRSEEERAATASEMNEELFLFTLQQARRPPLDDCWLVHGIVPMRHHAVFAGDTGGC